MDEALMQQQPARPGVIVLLPLDEKAKGEAVTSSADTAPPATPAKPKLTAKKLKVSNPRDPEEVAKALLTREPKKPEVKKKVPAK